MDVRLKNLNDFLRQKFPQPELRSSRVRENVGPERNTQIAFIPPSTIREALIPSQPLGYNPMVIRKTDADVMVAAFADLSWNGVRAHFLAKARVLTNAATMMRASGLYTLDGGQDARAFRKGTAAGL